MREQFKVREAAAGDEMEIGRVNVDGWRTAYAGIMPGEFLLQRSVETSAASWKRNLAAKRSLLLVAEKDGVIRGFLDGGKAREDLPGFDSEVYAIYVDKEMRGLGAGAALLLEFWAREAARGVRSCAIWVLEENPHRRFYEKMGGELLPLRKTGVFGGKPLTEVAYAWRALRP